MLEVVMLHQRRTGVHPSGQSTLRAPWQYSHFNLVLSDSSTTKTKPWYNAPVQERLDLFRNFCIDLFRNFCRSTPLKPEDFLTWFLWAPQLCSWQLLQVSHDITLLQLPQRSDSQGLDLNLSHRCHGGHGCHDGCHVEKLRGKGNTSAVCLVCWASVHGHLVIFQKKNNWTCSAICGFEFEL